jgi:DNA-directed RNA polymerase specialized sigma24 family protein
MPATLWTLVLTARDVQSPDTQAALAKLCEIYWYPLYAFVRRQGRDHHQAQDLTQGFFEYLFQREWLKNVDKEKGRFRTFLLRALSNFLCNEREKAHSLKRGGPAQQLLSWDAKTAESRLKLEPAAEHDPAIDFDRLWTCAIVEKAIDTLSNEYARCGKDNIFIALSPFLTRPVEPGCYAEMAGRLRMTEGALRIAMHRLVLRFGELLRLEVAQTVTDPASVDEELRDILRSWAR